MVGRASDFVAEACSNVCHRFGNWEKWRLSNAKQRDINKYVNLRNRELGI